MLEDLKEGSLSCNRRWWLHRHVPLHGMVTGADLRVEQSLADGTDLQPTLASADLSGECP